MSKFPLYCEQPYCNAFFEPLNTLTNLFFILAGIVLLVKLKKRNRLNLFSGYFSIILITIGIGSFAWHFHRTSFSLASDSFPIMLFVISYLVAYVFYVTKKLFFRVLLILSFFAYTYLLGSLLRELNWSFLYHGGLSYGTAISYFAVMQIHNLYFKIPLVRQSLFITGVFLISLFFRQIDLMLCDSWGQGTHFVWHTLNALTLYLMVDLLYLKEIKITKNEIGKISKYNKI